MGIFSKRPRPQVHVPAVFLGSGGPLPPKGDLIQLGTDQLLEVHIAQDEIPEFSNQLALMALNYLDKPMTQSNIDASIELTTRLIVTSLKNTLLVYVEDPAAYEDATQRLASKGTISLDDIRDTANQKHHGGFLWDYNIIKTFSMMVHDGGALELLPG